MNHFGFSEETVNKLHHIFSPFHEIEEVVIYGSRAMGKHHPFSDVDITIVGKEVSTKTLSQILLKIDDLLLPYEFDISIYHKIQNLEVLQHIKRVGQALYARSANENI